MPVLRKLLVTGAAAACVVAAPVVAYSRAAESRAPAFTQIPRVPDDTAAVARLLRVVRGVDPLLCELATRHVDSDGWWSRGSPSGNPLDGDSAAAALIAWIQRDHTDPRVVPALAAGLRDGDRCVRRVAGAFLGRVEHPSATAALLEGLGHPSADTRFVSAIGLGLSESQNALQPLLGHLRDPSADVRRAVAWALGSLEARAAMLPLIEVLQKDADARVREAAAWAIGRVTG